MKGIQIRVIRRGRVGTTDVSVPPSKSLTNRALIAAALARGTSIIHNPSIGEDSMYLRSALSAFGAVIREKGSDLEIDGTDGHPSNPGKTIFLGNAGTSLRFLISFSVLAEGDVILTGDEHMIRRPVGDLIHTLRAAGIACTDNNGFPPIHVTGGSFPGGRMNVRASASSQFVSSILLAAPYARETLTLSLPGVPSSAPYIEMTLDVMRAFGAKPRALSAVEYRVGNSHRYRGTEYTVEGDASSASYFLAAAAITGGTVRIINLAPSSHQGDTAFIRILESMGCTTNLRGNTINLTGGPLTGVDVDMNALPDCVPTLAIVALFAKGPTTIRNISHLRYKETDRIKAIATELSKTGANVEVADDAIVIHPPAQPSPAEIETYEDHRIAMSFAVAGLRLPGMRILNPLCVAKSFPHFWEEFLKFEEGAS
jgi:3-phosphoshikimate 1-carboxyvinyltransferase